MVADKDTYQNDTRDFTPVLTPIASSSIRTYSCSRASLRPMRRRLPRSARELGFKGLISTETAQDAGKVLEEGKGDLANGFISVGGASTPDIRSKAMEEFIDRQHYNSASTTTKDEHWRLRAPIYHRHAEGRSEGDRQHRRIQEDGRFLLRAEPLSQGPRRRRSTTSARTRSARSASSSCRWSSTSTKTLASSIPCSLPLPHRRALRRLEAFRKGRRFKMRLPSREKTPYGTGHRKRAPSRRTMAR